MIENIGQLNEFVKLSGVKSEGQIIPKLIENKILITPQMAKLIIDKQAPVLFA